MTPLLLLGGWLLAAAPAASCDAAQVKAGAPACAPPKDAPAPVKASKAPAAKTPAPAAGAPSAADAWLDSREDTAEAEKSAPLRWDVPGLIAWVDTQGPVTANGVPVLIQLARSTRSVDELAVHFVRFFEKSQLFIPPMSDQSALTSEPQLTALDPVKMLSYTVILQANRDKTTSVILGTANVGAWKPATQSQLLGWAPLMPGARNVLRTDAEGQSSAAYDVDSTPDKVQTFYREAFTKAGFKPTTREGEYQRDTEFIRVRARTDDRGGLMVWLVRQLGGESSAPPP